MAIEWDGQVGPPGQRCAVSGRELAPGEEAWGLLRPAGDRFERIDIASESWAGFDRSGVVSWWRFKVPAPVQGKRLVLDAGALLRIFADLGTRDERPARILRWLVALWLLRGRTLHLVRMGKDGSLTVQERGGGATVLADPAATPEELDRARDDLLAAGGAAPG
ncbi:MAG: hypothetical protein RLZZ127_1095 [Planctomycetota bacterium]|jgi:hypothetical protein